MRNSSKQKSREEAQPKVTWVGDMPNSFDLHPCSSSRRRRMSTPYLPKEIIFKVLLCLPVEVLYNVMRYVCREWYKIISDPIFIDAHLQHSPKGILVQLIPELFYTQYVELGKHGVEITDLNLPQGGMRDGSEFGWFRPPYSQWGLPSLSYCSFNEINTAVFPGEIYGCCNGLVMFADIKCLGVCHVANLLLKQWISLPAMMDRDPLLFRRIGFAYAAATRQYKVVHVYFGRFTSEFEILTIGVDKAWRSLGNLESQSCMQGVDVECSALFSKPPSTTGGVIHWIGFPYVLSFNVEVESFHLSFVPSRRWDRSMEFLATESYLSLMVSCEEQIWEQWALTEVGTGTWLKLRTVDLSPQKQMIRSKLLSRVFHLYPICLQENGELVFFAVSGKPTKYFVYSVKTGKIHLFKFGGEGRSKTIDLFKLRRDDIYSLLDYGSCDFNFYPHVKSLVSLRDLQCYDSKVFTRTKLGMTVW